jgi:hypothetical protein
MPVIEGILESNEEEENNNNTRRPRDNRSCAD